MALSKQEVENIARLARIGVSEEESALYAEQLSSVLEYVHQLREVNTDNFDYHYQVADLENVMDDDEVHESTEEVRNALLGAMPQRVGDYLKVKGVFKE